jgi:pyrroline-5-carboxylate reductase
MIAGLLSGERLTPGQVVASHPRAERRTALEGRFGIRTTESNAAAVEAADTVVLAIKPQMLRRVGPELAGALRPEQLVISVLAGATTTALRNALHHDAIVRAMPNTPAQLGKGMTVWYATPEVSQVQAERSAALLGA